MNEFNTDTISADTIAELVRKYGKTPESQPWPWNSTASDHIPPYTAPPSDWPYRTTPDGSQRVTTPNESEIAARVVDRLLNTFGAQRIDTLLKFLEFLLTETDLGEEFRLYLAEQAVRGDGDEE